MRDIPTIEEPVPVLELSSEEIEELTADVRALAAERHALILAQDYQVPEIQDLAGFVGDSLVAAHARTPIERMVAIG